MEANDAYPVIFGSLTLLAMAVGYQVPLATLVAVTAGVSVYGCAYLFVHDVYIHARLGRLPVIGFLERLKWAHGVHHLFGGEPFGMLLPFVPKALRVRAARLSWDPGAEAAGYEPVVFPGAATPQ